MTKICPEDRIGVEMLNMFTRRVGIGTWKSLQFPAFWRTHCTPNDMDIRESWDTLSTPYRDKIRYSERARASDSSWNPGVSSVHRFYFHCRLFGEHSGLFSEHPKKWPSKKKHVWATYSNPLFKSSFSLVKSGTLLNHHLFLDQTYLCFQITPTFFLLANPNFPIQSPCFFVKRKLFCFNSDLYLRFFPLVIIHF